MRKSNRIIKEIIKYLMIALLFSCYRFCGEKENPLAAYKSSPVVEEIIIEQETFFPRFTWKGGYVSAFGINRGFEARLDSTLQWLVHIEGDNIHYPVKYGELPSGATDLTIQFGGRFEEFIEDSTYTYWMVKSDVWESVAANAGKYICRKELDDGVTFSNNDTLFIDPHYHIQKSCWIDVYTNVNMSSLKCRGKLATIYLAETDTSNSPIMTWEIVDNDVVDTLISAVGVCEGSTYGEKLAVWEVWSIDSSSGTNVYGKNNVIEQPVIIGQEFANTRVFAEYPEKGLSRNKTYMFWIANAGWDGLGHSRATAYHAYITFNTW